MEIAELENRTKVTKIERAQAFYNHLEKNDLKFFGVSGSVSYSPAENDDIDIFLICKKGKLWRFLFHAFLVRRRLGMEDICISLSMDEEFADGLFKRDAEYVVASDAVHVIPLFGKEYYSTLLARSPFVRRYFPDFQIDYDVATNEQSQDRNLFDEFYFLGIAPYLLLKSFMNNRRVSSIESDGKFSTKIGLHHFYFDSEKYRKLKMEEVPEF